jgi:uncharacterized protein YjbJ (UPF0337 family)
MSSPIPVARNRFAIDSTGHVRRLFLAILALEPSRVFRHSCLASTRDRKELPMNWDRIEGNWKQVKGKVREKWGDLTDSDIEKINGRRDQLEGMLQERYGYGKDVASKNVDEWLKTMH